MEGAAESMERLEQMDPPAKAYGRRQEESSAKTKSPVPGYDGKPVKVEGQDLSYGWLFIIGSLWGGFAKGGEPQIERGNEVYSRSYYP